MPIQAPEQQDQAEVEREQFTSFYLVYPMNSHDRLRILSVHEFCQSRIHTCYQRVSIPGDFASIIALYIHVAEENARF